MKVDLTPEEINILLKSLSLRAASMRLGMPAMASNTPECRNVMLLFDKLDELPPYDRLHECEQLAQRILDAISDTGYALHELPESADEIKRVILNVILKELK